MNKSKIITIVIPVKSPQELVASFLETNKKQLRKYKVVVVDSGGGEILEKYASTYLKEDLALSFARRRGYEFVKTPFTFNLDADVKIPETFFKDAMKILNEQEDVAVVALDYEKSMGHYGFGCSLWRTDILKKLYRWKRGKPECECVFMWHRTLIAGKKLETLPYRAVHLREK
jgi:glycosyltransferase involved in cell wall biosynthesis